MNRSITPTHAAAVLAFVAMAGISSMRTPSTASVESPATTASSKVHTREDARAKRYRPPEAVQQRIEKIRQTKDPGERMRETMDLVNSLPIAELKRWIERGWFAPGEGYERKVFTLLAKKRWKRDDPEGFAAWGLQTKKDGRDVLVEWARTNPPRMLEFFQKHPDPMLELQLWATASNLDPGFAMRRLLELAKTGGLDRSFDYWPVDKIASVIAEGNPSLLEKHLDELPVQWRGKLEGVLVAGRLQTDFPAEIGRLAETPDGWTQLMRAKQDMENFSLRVLDSVADFPDSWKASLADDPGGLVNDPRWLDVDLKALGFTTDQARKILTEAMRMAVFSSPEKVLGGLHEANLTEAQRKTVMASLFHSGNDPNIVAGMLVYLKTPELRELAATMLKPPSSSEGSGEEVMANTPVPAKPQGNRMEQLVLEGSVASFRYMQESSVWSEETAAVMLRDFKALPEEQKRVAAGIIAGDASFKSEADTSRALSGEAIRFLIDDLARVDESWRAQSEDRQSQQAALHAATWVTEDPLEASQWVLTLPAGKPRDQAIQLLTETWKRYDPDAADRWVDALPTGDRDALKAQH